MNRIALTGIKPTGPPHIGNYLGMIKPALELAEDHQALYFLADYHALTTVKDREQADSANLRGCGCVDSFRIKS